VQRRTSAEIDVPDTSRLESAVEQQLGAWTLAAAQQQVPWPETRAQIQHTGVACAIGWKGKSKAMKQARIRRASSRLVVSLCILVFLPHRRLPFSGRSDQELVHGEEGAFE